VLAEDLAAEGGAGDVHQVLPASRTIPIHVLDDGKQCSGSVCF
jgi:hypothetical protein